MTTTDLELRAPSGPPSLRDLPGGVPETLQAAYPDAFDPDMDIAEALEMAGVDQIRLSDLTRVKVPAAEFDDLMVPDPERDGKLKPVDELVGLVVGMTARRSYWQSKQVTGAAPDCSSRDLKVGDGMYGPGSEGNPTGECAKCPMAAFGSANTGTNASACKEQKLIFLLTGEELLPYMLVVPPGSLQNHKGFGMKLFKARVKGATRDDVVDDKGRPGRGSAWSAVELGVKLEKDQNKAGERYNKLTFRINRRLDADELAVVDLYARFVEGLIQEQADALDTVTGNADAPGMIGSAADGIDDEGFPEDDVVVPAAKGKSSR